MTFPQSTLYGHLGVKSSPPIRGYGRSQLHSPDGLS